MAPLSKMGWVPGDPGPLASSASKSLPRLGFEQYLGWKLPRRAMWPLNFLLTLKCQTLPRETIRPKERSIGQGISSAGFWPLLCH